MIRTTATREIYFSKFLGERIYDSLGILIGKVFDIAVHWSGNAPAVSCIKFAKNFQAHISLALVKQFTETGLILTIPQNELIARALQDDEIYVSKWLLDKQIIDRSGSKLVRVNDIKLFCSQGDISFVAVDIGIRGLFRRLGLEFFVKNHPDKFLEWQYITPLESKGANLKLAKEHVELKNLHSADIADIIEDLGDNERRELINNMDDEAAAAALTQADLITQIQVICQLDEVRASNILEKMPPDEAADILGALPEDKSELLLSKMDAEEAEDVRELMTYEENVAGSLMTTEFVALPMDLTVIEAITELRGIASEAETINNLYITDENAIIRGVCSLRQLIIADSESKLVEFMQSKIISVLNTDELHVAYDAILKYNLLAVPVVNSIGKMLGIITVDDVLHAAMPTRSKLKTFSHFMLTSYKDRK